MFQHLKLFICSPIFTTSKILYKGCEALSDQRLWLESLSFLTRPFLWSNTFFPVILHYKNFPKWTTLYLPSCFLTCWSLCLEFPLSPLPKIPCLSSCLVFSVILPLTTLGRFHNSFLYSCPLYITFMIFSYCIPHMLLHLLFFPRKKY